MSGKRMGKAHIVHIVMLLVLLPVVEIAYAQEAKKATAECQPVYGHYWRSYKWGWYGAPREVKNQVEAREIIEQFFLQYSGVRVVRIRENIHFYVAEIVNSNGALVDLVLIDKRTGRIRSMY